ncbi:OR4M1 protein, partial [Dromaius novaehollandiae]|nr:OR4M1 protein [Dromaius novaehollandiae]
METGNKTEVMEFVLLGLSQTHEVQLFLFFLFLLFYVIVLPGNILIILTVRRDPQLDSPMYFFLAHLAFLDICYCSITPPKMLADFFSQRKTISSRSCIAQLFFLHFLGGAEIFLLIAMAFDRYVAICKPLHYATLMKKMVCWILVVAAWAGGFTHSLIQVAFVVHLPFCGPNELDNFFCDVTQVIKLACTNTYVLEFIIFVNSGLVILICFILLLLSYGVLVIRLKTGISKGKRKAVSTCITHIIIVFVMFGPAMYIYCRPFCSLPLDKVVAVFHTVVFPLMNPMIYTLRNREILGAMKQLLARCCL